MLLLRRPRLNRFAVTTEVNKDLLAWRFGPLASGVRKRDKLNVAIKQFVDPLMLRRLTNRSLLFLDIGLPNIEYLGQIIDKKRWVGPQLSMKEIQRVCLSGA
jgi:hypothetical protein